jgi:molecular chaperone GrpE
MEAKENIEEQELNTNETVEENTTSKTDINEGETTETNEKSEEMSVEQKIKELEENYQTINEKYLRLYSEFDNFKRRTGKEKLELISTASFDVMKEMVSVLDDMNRALESNEKTSDLVVVKEGMKLITNKFNSILSKKGLTEMEAKGVEFDADLHEALTSIPAPSEDMVGKVVDVIEKGYLLNGKVVRFAKVVVGS